MFTATLLCSELRASRVGIATFTDQVLMENLISNFTDSVRETFMEGDETSAMCTWPGVTCDEQDNVTSIAWADDNLSDGNILLDMLPPHLTSCILSHWDDSDTASLRGTLSTSSLPEGLTVLNLTTNDFHGKVDFAALPPCMRVLDLSYNTFEGSADLENLPESLEELSLQFNAFAGKINLCSLPEGIESLDLKSNFLTGGVTLDRLPAGMLFLGLAENKLSGELELQDISDRLVLDLQDNDFDDVDEYD